MDAIALQKSMETASRKCRKESEDEQTRRKRKKVDLFANLTDDILLDILKRVPDAFLRYKAKYVCRRWFNIITKRILLNHASFILENDYVVYTSRHVDIREERKGLEVEEQYLDIPGVGMIRSWCNEFLLISDDNKKGSLYVYNLITKEGSYLPQYNASCGGHYDCKCGVALSFDRVKGIYKVVHMVMGPPIQCEVLVLRRDVVSRVSSKWKKMEIPCMNVGQYCWRDAVSVQGRYFHWEISFNHLLSMDMVKEEIFQVSRPGFSTTAHYLFEMGGSLALFDRVSSDKAEIWILKDIWARKWEKLQSVTLHNWCATIRPNSIRDLYPVCGVISKRYIILESRPVPFTNIDRLNVKRLFSYDLKYGVVKELDILMDDNDRCVVHSSAPRFK